MQKEKEQVKQIVNKARFKPNYVNCYIDSNYI